MTVRRETQVHVSLRSVWVRALVAVTLFAVLAWGWWSVFTYVRDTLDLAFIAYPVGIGTAIAGYLVVGLVFRRFGPRARPLHRSGGNLTASVSRRLSSLDPLLHRVHPLGTPWPQAVVTSSGVHVVEPLPVSGTFSVDGVDVRVGGHDLEAASYAEVRRLVPVVRDLLAARGLAAPVSGLMVVDDGAVVPLSLQSGERPIRFIHVDQVPEAVGFAPTLTAEQVDRTLEVLTRWRPHRRRRPR